jgi:hypothetical protein
MPRILFHRATCKRKGTCAKWNATKGRGDIAPVVLNLRHQTWVRGRLHISPALHTENELTIPIQQEAGWAPHPVHTQWQREKDSDQPPIF